MCLISNWKDVLTRSWSVWAILASIACIGAFFFATVTAYDLGLPPIWFAALSALFQGLAPVLRIVAQASVAAAFKEFRQDTSGAIAKRAAATLGGGALVVALATPFIAQWEGVRLSAYRDIVGVPTICFGDTQGVAMGDTATIAGCQARLAADVRAFYAEIRACMTNASIPAGVQASMLELAYNVGAGPVCRSTMMRRANAGQYRAACDELRRWVMAGGRRIRGLENRRADSKRRLCLQGLS